MYIRIHLGRRVGGKRSLRNIVFFASMLLGCWLFCSVGRKTWMARIETHACGSFFVAAFFACIFFGMFSVLHTEEDDMETIY